MNAEIIMKVEKIYLNKPNKYIIRLSGHGYGCEITIEDIFKFINLLQIRKHTTIYLEDIIGQLIDVVFVDNIAKKIKSLIIEEYIDL